MAGTSRSELTKFCLALWPTASLLRGRASGSEPVGETRGADHPSCKDGDGDLSFDVPLAIDVIGAGRSTGSDKGILLKDITLDLRFFNGGVGGRLTCLEGLGEKEKGDLTLQEGSEGSSGHAFLLFHFRHSYSEIRHSLEMYAIIHSDTGWLPTTESTMTEGPEEKNGHWIVKASGRDHQSGCTGEGEDLNFLATILPLS